MKQPDAPTRPGWYWGRAKSGLAWRPWWVEHGPDGLVVTAQALPGLAEHSFPLHWHVAEWGPEIPEPAEPEKGKTS